MRNPDPEVMKTALDDIIKIVEWGPTDPKLLLMIGRIAWEGVGEGQREPEDDQFLEELDSLYWDDVVQG